VSEGEYRVLRRILAISAITALRQKWSSRRERDVRHALLGSRWETVYQGMTLRSPFFFLLLDSF
jgi:hypothetical protein